MTVSQLIDALAKLDPNLTVWLAKDGEGNGFRHLASVQVEDMVCTSEQWNAEVLAPEDVEDYGEGVTKQVVLWPC